MRRCRRAARAAALVWLGCAALAAVPGQARAGGDAAPRAPRGQGPFGAYDDAAAQRGFAVFRAECASCHALGQVSWRDLGGIGLSSQAIHDLAAAHPGTAIDDPLAAPFATARAARAANGGALPPDLSRFVVSRARGADLIEAFLTGDRSATAGAPSGADRQDAGTAAGHLSTLRRGVEQGAVHYTDGTRLSVAQMSRDVGTFLAWAADPHLEARHRMGVRVVVYLALLSALLLVLQRRAWATIRD